MQAIKDFFTGTPTLGSLILVVLAVLGGGLLLHADVKDRVADVRQDVRKIGDPNDGYSKSLSAGLDKLGERFERSIDKLTAEIARQRESLAAIEKNTLVTSERVTQQGIVLQETRAEIRRARSGAAPTEKTYATLTATPQLFEKVVSDILEGTNVKSSEVSLLPWRERLLFVSVQQDNAASLQIRFEKAGWKAIPLYANVTGWYKVN